MSFYSKYSGEQIDNILTSIIESGNKNSSSSISIVNGYEELDPEAEIGSFALVRNVEEVPYVCELKDFKNPLEITFNQSNVVISSLKDRIKSPRIFNIDFKVPSGLINSYLSEDRTGRGELGFICLPRPIEEYPANVTLETYLSEIIEIRLSVSNNCLGATLFYNEDNEYIPIFDGSGEYSNYAFNLDFLSNIPGIFNGGGYFYLTNMRETSEEDHYEDNINYWSNWINALEVNKETYDLVIQSELNTGEKKWTKIEELNPLNLKSLDEYLLSYYDRKYYKELNVSSSSSSTVAPRSLELEETSNETIVLSESPYFGINPDTHYNITYNSDYTFAAVLNRSFFSPNTVSTEEYSINVETGDSSINGYLIFSDAVVWKSLTLIDYWNNNSQYSTLEYSDCSLYPEAWSIYNLLINNKKLRVERFSSGGGEE